MCRTAPTGEQLSFPRSPIVSTIAARLFSLNRFSGRQRRPRALPPLAGKPAPAAHAASQPTPSVVYRRLDPDAIHGYKTDPAVVRRMVNQLVLAVTHQSDLARAWRSLVSPKDKVGIKISAAGGELFTTHRDVVNAIVDGLVAAGQTRSNIIVWDRSLGGIKEAGYTGREGYQLRAIPPRDGYDPKATVSAPFLGNLIWGDLDYIGGKGESPLLGDDVEHEQRQSPCKNRRQRSDENH